MCVHRRLGRRVENRHRWGCGLLASPPVYVPLAGRLELMCWNEGHSWPLSLFLSLVLHVGEEVKAEGEREAEK